MNEEEYILDSLATLEKIEAGQKLSFYAGKFSITDKPNSFFRWINGDSKFITVAYITQVVNEAILRGLPLNTTLITSLENLKMTYHSNIEVMSQLTKIQLEIKNEINKRLQ
jgi:hypothetical protein